MFDWPVAAVLISTLVTAAVAIAKFAPQRGGSLAGAVSDARMESTDGRLARIETRLGQVEQNVSASRIEHREDMKELRELVARAIAP